MPHMLKMFNIVKTGIHKQQTFNSYNLFFQIEEPTRARLQMKMVKLKAVENFLSLMDLHLILATKRRNQTPGLQRSLGGMWR